MVTRLPSLFSAPVLTAALAQIYGRASPHRAALANMLAGGQHPRDDVEEEKKIRPIVVFRHQTPDLRLGRSHHYRVIGAVILAES
jgi:hypothetical protein